MFRNSVYCIIRATWVKPAYRSQHRWKHYLIELNYTDWDFSQRDANFFHNLLSKENNSWFDNLSKPLLPTTTISIFGNEWRCKRKLSRIMRFNLFLWWACLTLFLARVMPKRGLSEVLILASKVSWGETDGMALLKTYSKWVGVSSLSSREKLFSPTLDN